MLVVLSKSTTISFAYASLPCTSTAALAELYLVVISTRFNPVPPPPPRLVAPFPTLGATSCLSTPPVSVTAQSRRKWLLYSDFNELDLMRWGRHQCLWGDREGRRQINDKCSEFMIQETNR